MLLLFRSHLQFNLKAMQARYVMLTTDKGLIGNPRCCYLYKDIMKLQIPYQEINLCPLVFFYLRQIINVLSSTRQNRPYTISIKGGVTLHLQHLKVQTLFGISVLLFVLNIFFTNYFIYMH